VYSRLSLFTGLYGHHPSEPIEDTRVELKSTWIDVNNAARRIAGHANAARGAEILWVIGLHEKQGIVGAKYQELSEWYSKVQSQFESLCPQLLLGDVRIIL
jgi:hypothetical protein